MSQALKMRKGCLQVLFGGVVMRFREVAPVEPRSQIINVFQSPLDFGARLFDSMFDDLLVQRIPPSKSDIRWLSSPAGPKDF